MSTTPIQENTLQKVRLIEKDLFNEAQEGTGKLYLNANCGARVLEGFTNIDPFYEDEDVYNYDLHRLPYENGTVDVIYSLYLMETLEAVEAKEIFREWKRVLRPKTGRLLLSVPDTREIYKQLLDPSLEDSKRTWLQYLVNGTGLNPMVEGQGTVNLGDMTSCGFTKATLLREMWDCGFKVKDMFGFEGEGSPSIWLEAYA